jgi:hypothetical protein
MIGIEPVWRQQAPPQAKRQAPGFKGGGCTAADAAEEYAAEEKHASIVDEEGHAVGFGRVDAVLGRAGR